MFSRSDFKFALTLIISIAGVVAPVWFWQLDLKPKELTLKVKSVTEIQPQGIGAIDGLQVTVGGSKLNKPAVSVLELSNTGIRPIVAADFEGGLRIKSHPAVLVKSQLTHVTTRSLEPKTTVTEGAILLQPLLLNPGDALQFTVLTSDAMPEFSVLSRIAGVGEISVIDILKMRTTVRDWITKIVAVVLLTFYAANLAEVLHAGFQRRVFRSWTFMHAMILLVATFTVMWQAWGREGVSVSFVWPLLTVSLVLSIPISYIRLYKESSG